MKKRIALISDSTSMWIRPYRNHEGDRTYIEYLLDNEDIQVDIFSKPGMTSRDALELVWLDIMGGFYHTCIISVGINDCTPRSYPKLLSGYFNKKILRTNIFEKVIHLFYRFLSSIQIQRLFYKIGVSKPWISCSEFEENCSKIIEVLVKETDTSILMLAMPKTSNRVKNIFSGINNLISEYNAIIKSMKSERVNVLTLDGLFEVNYEKYIPEGIHYSAAGHELVYKEIMSVLSNTTEHK